MKFIVRFEDGSFLGAHEGGGLFFVETRAEAWQRPSQVVAAQDALALQPFSGFSIERVEESICADGKPHRFFGFMHESRCLGCDTLESAAR